ncbi:MAG: hypothetical protein IKQ37_05765 [Bacteroidaceae bacterium]|nr:hypothetical protein [Bacteroidaceae bacterium]
MKQLIILLAAVLLAACSQETPDERAARMLRDARYALHHHLWNEARDTILSLRRNCPTAIEARRQAILLLDSIEMNAAADSLKLVTGEEWKRLNVKRQFFERKLQEDLKSIHN